MKIWLINHYAVPPTQAGGTRHFSLSRELIRKKHRVTIIASDIDYLTREKISPGKGIASGVQEVEGVPFLWLNTPKYGDNKYARVWNMLVFAFRLLFSAPSRLRERPDVVVGSSPHPFAALAAERLARRFRVPFVLEVRDLWPETLIDLGNISPDNPFIRILSWIEKYLYQRADRIVSLLPDAVNHMVQKGADREKVVWIPNGVDFSLMPPAAPHVDDHVFTLMYAGAHGLANGLGSILDAAAILKREGFDGRVLFRLVGDGPEKGGLQKRVREEGLHCVRLEPPVPKNKVYQMMQSADAFIVNLKDSPVFKWGVSPNKIFDFMVSARPIIFGTIFPQNPVAEARAGIIVPPDDPDAIASAVKNLVNMPLAERISMGQRGQAYVKSNHSFDKLAERFEQTLLGSVGS